MATVSSNNASSFELMAKNFINKTCPSDPIKSLYPMVNEEDTPLPRHWNPKDRFSYLGLASNNLRVLYKGSLSFIWVVITGRFVIKLRQAAFQVVTWLAYELFCVVKLLGWLLLFKTMT